MKILIKNIKDLDRSFENQLLDALGKLNIDLIELLNNILTFLSKDSLLEVFCLCYHFIEYNFEIINIIEPIFETSMLQNIKEKFWYINNQITSYRKSSKYI